MSNVKTNIMNNIQARVNVLMQFMATCLVEFAQENAIVIPEEITNYINTDQDFAKTVADKIAFLAVPPSRPLKAMAIYAKAERARIKEELEQKNGAKPSTKDLNEALKAGYEALDDDSKNAFLEEEKKSKEEYQEKTKDLPKAPKALKDPNAPKKLSAFILFGMGERAKVQSKNKGMGATQITTELGRLWKIAKEKKSDVYKKYTKMAEDNKAKYDKDMAEYKRPSDDEIKLARKIVNAQKKVPTKIPGAPARRSAFQIFKEEQRDEYPDMKGKELNSKLSDEWKDKKGTEVEAEYKEKAKAEKAGK